jgi:hypothetical protein
MAGMEAGVNRFPRFLRSKNLKAKNGRDAGCRRRRTGTEAGCNTSISFCEAKTYSSKNGTEAIF